jgi:ribosomal RNA-processing protein 9
VSLLYGVGLVYSLTEPSPRSICLWTTQKKKPIFTQALAHGFNQVFSETEGLIETPRWVTAIASLRYSDLLASGTTLRSHIIVSSLLTHVSRFVGSWEGHIRLWKLDSKLKSFSLIGTVPAPGFVNSLQLISTPKDVFPSASWASLNKDSESSLIQRISTSASKVNTVLLVAGMGQEHRLGRWMKLNGDGVVNGTIVVALHPRTLG